MNDNDNLVIRALLAEKAELLGELCMGQLTQHEADSRALMLDGHIERARRRAAERAATMPMPIVVK